MTQENVAHRVDMWSNMNVMMRTVFSWMLAFAVGIGMFFPVAAMHADIAHNGAMDGGMHRESPTMADLCLVHCLVAVDHASTTLALIPLLVLACSFAIIVALAWSPLPLCARGFTMIGAPPGRGRAMLTTCKRE